MFSSYCDVIVLDGKKDGWIPKNIGVIVGVVVLVAWWQSDGWRAPKLAETCQFNLIYKTHFQGMSL